MKSDYDFDSEWLKYIKEMMDKKDGTSDFFSVKPDDFSGKSRGTYVDPGADSYVGWDFGFNPKPEKDMILVKIEEEAVEYFTDTFKTDMKFALNRIRLDKEQKQRVIGFMKLRLEHYDENGIIMKD